MKLEFSKIKENSRIIIHTNKEKENLEFEAVVIKHLKDNIATIQINNVTQALKFKNVNVQVIFVNVNGIPYIWTQCTIIFLKGQYLLQVNANGGLRYNRRGSFRVGVSKHATLTIKGKGREEVTVKDISLTGFAITDRTKSIQLPLGTQTTLVYEDEGYQLKIDGNVVRKEEAEDYIIYGFIITKPCQELSEYVNSKQRKKRNQK